MRLLTVSVITMILVHFCRAVDLKCTQSGSGKPVTSIVDIPMLPVNKSTCRFSWANRSDVLANHLGQDALVINKSLDSLLTTECFVELNWKADCTSEETGLLVDFTANCTSSCEQNELLLGDKGGLSALWIFVPILAVLALGYLLYKYRKKICSGSTPSCGQCGGLYTGVKTQNIQPEPVAVSVED